MKPTFIVLIPARYGSSRFPGKPLAKIAGMEMINRVYSQARKAVDNVVVATDDLRIFNCVSNFGGKAVMTSVNHKSGTDRIWEAYNNSGITADVIINVQGDEPFINPAQIEALMQCFIDFPDIDIATLARPYKKEKGFEPLFDPNVVKLTFSDDMNALYFSRSIIPYIRNHEWKQWAENHQFYTHIGIYAYRTAVLKHITSMPQSSLETAESLEQLRWLQNGLKIKVAISDYETIGIDTPEDLQQAEEYLQKLELK